MRDAVLTRSPATMPWPSAPIVTAASPVRTPARAFRAASSSGTAATRSSPARTARSASSSWRDRCSPDGHHGVADELLDCAAVALDDGSRRLEVEREKLARVLRVALSDAAVKPTRSAKRTETRRRSAAGALAAGAAAAGAVVAPSAVPHSPQNFTDGAFGVPHDGHVCASVVPHSPQNFRPASFAEPHAGQEIVSDTAQL